MTLKKYNSIQIELFRSNGFKKSIPLELMSKLSEIRELSEKEGIKRAVEIMKEFKKEM